VEEVLRNAAAADPELRELWQASEDERRVEPAPFVDALLLKGPLKGRPRPGRRHRRALGTHRWDAYRRLVNSRGRPIQRSEQWLADTYCTLLLGTPYA
jgi:hypothetical protein